MTAPAQGTSEGEAGNAGGNNGNGGTGQAPDNGAQSNAGANNGGTGGDQSQNSGQGSQGNQGGTDKGYPENTPIAEMTDAQRAAYFKHQNRKAENALSGYKGVTPEQVEQMQAQLKQYEDAQLSAGDKAIRDAADKAAKDARAESDAEWLAKYQRSELRGYASEVLKGEQLNAFLAAVNPAVFADEQGEIDQQKVMGHLTAMYGLQNGQQQGGPGSGYTGGQQQNGGYSWGQNSGGSGAAPGKPGEAGRAAAEARHGTKK